VVAEETAVTERNRWELYFFLIDAEAPIARHAAHPREKKSEVSKCGVGPPGAGYEVKTATGDEHFSNQIKIPSSEPHADDGLPIAAWIDGESIPLAYVVDALVIKDIVHLQ
jgi:hypothetical protein